MKDLEQKKKSSHNDGSLGRESSRSSGGGGPLEWPQLFPTFFMDRRGKVVDLSPPQTGWPGLMLGL